MAKSKLWREQLYGAPAGTGKDAVDARLAVDAMQPVAEQGLAAAGQQCQEGVLKFKADVGK